MMRYLLSLLAAGILAPAALSVAQAGQPLGSDFIFFRNGANTSIPYVSGTVEEDPSAPDQFFIRYDYGDRAYPAFSWNAGVGVDMTDNLSDNDILHLKLKADTANAGKENTFLLLEDKTSGQPEDLPMRLAWRIPERYKDGQWHSLDIPLPPPACDNLRVARGVLDLGDYWWYGGSWSDSTQRVGGYDDECGDTANNPEYWKEFEWTNVKSLGVFWDHDLGGGSIWLDDVYIGQPGLDLSVADNPPASLSQATYEVGSEGNRISWTHDPESQIGAYRVYGSGILEEITDDAIRHGLDSGWVSLVGQVNASASEFSLTHYFQYLHPGLALFQIPVPVSYAVTTVSQFGIENFNVAQTSQLVENDQLALSAFISELTDTQADKLSDDIGAGHASGAGFGDGWPVFELNQNRGAITGMSMPPDGDDDLSGKFMMGHTPDNELYIYAAVLDDDVQLPQSEDPATAPWEYDVIEMGWANYAAADPIFGSSHQRMERGTRADYQFRIAGKGDGTQAFVWVEAGIGSIPSGSAAVYDVFADASDNAVGYKILARIPLDGIQNPATGDEVIAPPLGQDVVSRTLNIVLHDRDGDAYQSQMQWTLKHYADDQWWNTPAQWQPISMAGRNSWQRDTAAETEVPQAYALEQNYPNPFNPQTTIRFAIPSAQRVTLTVHDILGRTVATILSGQTLRSGVHHVQFSAEHLSSGTYIYRLQAGTAFVQSKRMLLIK